MSNDQTVSMSGWTNIRNEPMCQSYKERWRYNFGENQYLLELVNEAIKAFEEFKSNVGSAVTDNAMNVTKMRKQLAEYRS